MISVLARYEIHKGNELEAVAAVTKMTEAVKAEEPGCLLFVVTRGQVNPQEIYIFEGYSDQGAFDAHRKTPQMREWQAALDKYLDRSSFNVELLDTVARFIQ
jgi:quinol monooxygenase YgiN